MPPTNDFDTSAGLTQAERWIDCRSLLCLLLLEGPFQIAGHCCLWSTVGRRNDEGRGIEWRQVQVT